MTLAMQRRLVTRQIRRDPWDILVFRDGDNPFAVEGSVSPAGARGVPLMSPNGLPGEDSVAQYRSVLLLEWDATELLKDDRLEATHRASGIVNRYRVVHPRHTPTKWEIMLDESA